jgi:hypothetical protein
MKLTDLNPHWLGHGGEGVTNKDGKPIPYRHGIGISFDCPCGQGDRVAIMFENPLDCGARLEGRHAYWRRDGATFEDLTLSPSIQRADPGGCRWHGFVSNGEIRTV